MENGEDSLPLTYPDKLPCGFNITNGGSHITLDEDMECNGTAIYISADDVTLDCYGHKIIGKDKSFRPLICSFHI